MGTHIKIARLEARVFNCKVTTDGVAQPLGSCYITFTVKNKYTDSDANALFQLSIGSGITITNTLGGEYDLTIHSTATTNVTKSDKPASFYFDHRIQLPSGNIKVLEEGSFVVNPNVTDTMA